MPRGNRGDQRALYLTHGTKISKTAWFAGVLLVELVSADGNVIIYPDSATMNLRLLLLVCSMLATAASGQTLSPELVPLAAKYKADLAAIDSQRAAAIAQAQRPYSSALDAAEKTATATGDLASVSAITKEREAVKNDLMAPEFPTGLPRGLQTSRKAYLESLARIRTAEMPRRKAADADYLRALASLQLRAANNTELAQQIAREKETLLAGTLPEGSSKSAGIGSLKPTGRNALVNGTFDVADAEGKPTGWTFPDRKEASIKVVREGSNNVLRATLEGEVRPFYITQEIPIPPRTKTVTLSGRVRGKWENRDTKDGNWGATIDSTFLGADEKKFGGWIILVGGREAGWANLSKTKDIPEGAKALHVHFGFQFVTGTFDFDDISVEFR